MNAAAHQVLPRALFAECTARLVGMLTTNAGADAQAWHTRLTVLHFLTVFLARHAFWLDASSRRTVLDAVLPLLGDAQADVAQATKRLLTVTAAGALLAQPLPLGRGWKYVLDLGLNAAALPPVDDGDRSGGDDFMDADLPDDASWRFHAATMVDVRVTAQSERATAERMALIKKFLKWARAKAVVAAFGGSTASDTGDAHLTRTRLAGVFGCAALVNSEPFAVPSWLPALLDELISLTTVPKQPLAVTQELQKLVAEFRRTHADRWEELQLAFTESQLDALRDMQAPPSYIT